MIQGTDFDSSYAPTTNPNCCRIAICLASSKGFIITVYDISNAFQSTIETNPNNRHHISLPPLYLAWFKSKWPRHPISRVDPKTLVMQTLRCIQGTKDAGRKWYLLLLSIFKKLNIIPCPNNKGTFFWKHNNYKAYLLQICVLIITNLCQIFIQVAH